MPCVMCALSEICPSSAGPRLLNDLSLCEKRERFNKPSWYRNSITRSRDSYTTCRARSPRSFPLWRPLFAIKQKQLSSVTFQTRRGCSRPVVHPFLLNLSAILGFRSRNCSSALNWFSRCSSSILASRVARRDRSKSDAVSLCRRCICASTRCYFVSSQVNSLDAHPNCPAELN
jgi:hypothetical protein